MQSIGTPAKLDTTIPQEPQELLPNRRPNTEDFLTFLCFRSSSVLPSHLDFFNTNKKPTEKAESKPTTSLSSNSAVAGSSTSKSTETLAKKPETIRKIVDAVSEPIPSDVEKPNFIPFAVRKHADTVAIGSRRQSTLQSKKRNAEQRAINGQTRSRTRLSTKDSHTSEELVDVAKVNDNKSLNESKNSSTNTPNKEMRNKRKLRSSLIDSNSSNKDEEIEAEKEPAPQREPESQSNEKIGKKLTRKSKQTENDKDKLDPDEEERPEKIRKEIPVVKETVLPIAKNTKSTVTPKTKKDESTKVKKEEQPAPTPLPAPVPAPAPITSRMTRQKSFYAARVELEESSSEKEIGKKKIPKKKSLSDGFSSEDEKPLAKTVEKTDKTPATKRNSKRQSIPKNKATENINESNKNVDQKSEYSSQDSEPIAKKRFSGRKSVTKTVKTQSRSSVKDDLKSGNDSQDDTENTTNTKTKKKRRNEFTDLSQTDQSENETGRTGRPMRKTKEAATIYMELIGQKLNLSDFDDDNYSLDSFPELPNVKKTEQMENEIRANFAKDKKDAKPSNRGRRKTVDKKEIPEIEEKKVPVKKENVAPKTMSTSTKENGSAKAKLGKSFSDSDDEPLAIKCNTKSKKKQTPNAARKEVKSVEKPVTKSMEKSRATLLKSEAISKNSKADKDNSPVVAQSPKSAPVALVVPKVERIHVAQVDELQRKQKQQPVIKDIELGDSKFKVPAESVAQLLSPPIHVNTPKAFLKEVGTGKNAKAANKDAPSSNSKNSAQGISAILADLMPSKEESGKIFGIASVTLAQSSGPNDTKCTLGKCGSVHKPSLGPVVPTESYFTEQLTSKERRKAKVNMTQEQILKWLTECPKNLEPLDTDSLDEDLDLNKPIKPINYMSTPSPFRERETFDRSGSPIGKASKSLAKIKEKEKDLDKEKERELIIPIITPTRVITPSTKGPSLKAKTIPLKDVCDVKDNTKSPPLPSEQKSSSSQPLIPPKQIKSEKIQSVLEAEPAKKSASPVQMGATNSKKKSDVSTANKKIEKSVPSPSTVAKLKTKSPMSTIDLTKSPLADKKPIYNRRTPVYNTKGVQITQKVKIPKVENAFGAFSPDNEASVYSFDKEEDTILASTPFRRHSVRDSNNLEEGEKSKSPEEKVTPTKTSQTSTPDNSKKPPTGSKKPAAENKDGNLGSKKLAAENKKSAVENNKKPAAENKKSLAEKKKAAAAAAIAEAAAATSATVTTTTAPPGAAELSSSCENIEISKLKQLSEKLASQAGVETTIDADGQTFYIPLHTASTSSSADQVIRGVAIKLGTEGPEGPNQKVTMHAKLVTKSKMGTNTSTPLPEGFENVSDILKSLMESKDSPLKSIPVGTVQPRTKNIDAVPTSPTTTKPIKPTTIESPAKQNSTNLLNSAKSKAANQRQRIEENIQPSNKTSFPRIHDAAQMVEAPIFRPTEKEFQDPIDYIEKITALAAPFGLCKIVPPPSFKPECKISDDMRFTAYNQYVHKMLNRWGPNVKELSAIKKYLATQSITLKQPPWIGGMEVDLPRLYHTVQELGGLKEVIEKKKWARVAEEMCIPKTAQDRVTKLDDIYCKYLLPYDTLSTTERQKLFDEVEADWAKAEAKARRHADRSGLSESNTNQDSEEEEEESEDEDDDADSGSMECIVKGKSMALNAFFRIARNTMALWFKNTEPTASDIETEFWRHVAVRDSHVCVHSGSIDSSGWGYGFLTPGPKAKGSPCSKHPWNLKVLTNNHRTILRSIGQVAGVTVPTLHVGMLFSACCWYRDPHGLPWIEYIHTGGTKIWYGVPEEQSDNFRSAFTSLVPTHCQNKTVWLPCDTAMVPPHMLTDRGVSLCRTEQEPGQFVIVFPRAYTSSLCTSYTISESVYFATVSWLDTGKEDFKVILRLENILNHNLFD